MAALERSGECDAVAAAERLLSDRERSMRIDAALEVDARLHEVDASPHQLLLVGRDSGSIAILLSSLARCFPVLAEHTRLEGAGLHQLAVDVGGTRLCLMDICGSHGGAASDPTRLRKAVKHFGDSLAGAIVVVGLDDLCNPDSAALVAELVAVIAKCCSSGSSADAASALPLFLVLSQIELAPTLHASGALSHIGVHDGDDELRVANTARAACLVRLTPPLAASVHHLTLRLDADEQVRAAVVTVAASMSLHQDSLAIG